MRRATIDDAPALVAQTRAGMATYAEFAPAGWSVDQVDMQEHLERIRTHGGRVSRGTVVGYEGSTGNSNGCHLHFEVYEDGSFVDPRNYL